MNRPQKILITALAVVILLGAAPAFADLDGVWAGEGEGSCCAPDNTIIYPWQIWEGEVAEGVFEGEWYNDDGSHGGFSGGIIYFYVSVEPGAHTWAHCEGTWTWIGPDSTEPVEMGGFNMEFDLDAEICEGNWWTPGGVAPGSMTGEKISD